MLQVSYIRENREKVLERLSVKNFKQPEIVDAVISLDEERRQTQTTLDSISAEANTIAKQVGELMRQGKKEEAEILKSRTASLKEQIKTLGDKLSKAEAELLKNIVLLPNLPHSSVPRGTTPEENENIFEFGDKPALYAGNNPRYAFVKFDVVIGVER